MEYVRPELGPEDGPGSRWNPPRHYGGPGARRIVEPVRVGPFWLQGLIGAGGQANVFYGTGDRDGKLAPLVVKVFNDGTEETRRRVLRSVRAQTRLKGIGVPELYLVGSDPSEPPWTAQEVCGRDLATMLRQSRRDGLDQRQLSQLANSVARTLEHAHRCGVLHRDVKPSNVLSKGGPYYRLCDFDMAKTDGDTTLTMPGHGVGTLGYSAPEQLLGQRATEASDVYALAATLVTAATGNFPSDEVAGLLGHDQAPELSETARDRLNGLADWVAQALSFNPSDRPTLEQPCGRTWRYFDLPPR